MEPTDAPSPDASADGPGTGVTGADAPAPHPAAGPRNPVLPVVLAWLLPGAGHFAIQRPWPGIFVGAAIWPLFLAGFVLSGFENVAWDRHPWLFSVQVLAGGPTLAAALLTRGAEYVGSHTVADLYTCVAGLLNLVAIADVWARCVDGDPEARRERKRRADAEAAADVQAHDPTSLVRGDAPAGGSGGAGS